MVQQPLETKESTFESMNNTLDGFIKISSRETNPSNDESIFIVDENLAAFEIIVRNIASSSAAINGNDEYYASIVKIPEAMRVSVMNSMLHCREFVLDWAWSKGSQDGRERAVRYYRVFCAILGVSPVIVSHRYTWVLQYFAAFMGCVWIKRGKKAPGDDMAATTVEQMVSQVRRWLAEVHGVKVLDFDAMTSKVVKGLKKRAGTSHPAMFTPEITYKFMQDYWAAEKNEIASVHADMQAMRYAMMRRISEVCNTNSHNDLEPGNHSRYLLHSKTWIEGDSLFWCWWPTTKNSIDLVRSIGSTWHDIFARFKKRWLDNEVYLEDHPNVDRNTLPFFHIDGKPLHRTTVAAEMARLVALAFVTEPGVGHLDPSKFRITTHSDRKGGACFYLANIQGIEGFVRFLGDWVSLSFYDYAMQTRASAALAGNSIGDAFKKLFNN